MKNFHRIHGYRRQWNSTSLFNDVSAYLVGGQTENNTPTAGTTYYIVSTSVQDLTAGTGVDRVKIVYLDASGYQKTKVANLNGTTAVSISNDISFVQWIETYHSTTANRVAAGNVSISSINGVATEATTIDLIRAGGNRSQSCRYKVPTGARCKLIDYHASAAKLTGGGSTEFNVEIRALIFNDDNLISNTYHFQGGFYLTSGTSASDDLHFKELPAGAIVKMSIIPDATADGNIIKATFDLEVTDDFVLV